MDAFGYNAAETVSQAGESISPNNLQIFIRCKCSKSSEKLGTAQRERMQNRASTRMPTFTPLDRSLITKIKAVFSSANRPDFPNTLGPKR